MFVYKLAMILYSYGSHRHFNCQCILALDSLFWQKVILFLFQFCKLMYYLALIHKYIILESSLLLWKLTGCRVGGWKHIL